jgi:hypothetical protein
VKKYKNQSGKSGIHYYDIGKDFIKIKFKDSSDIYTYNSEKPGKFLVAQMKILAETGIGLSTFISQNVKDNYFSKV